MTLGTVALLFVLIIWLSEDKEARKEGFEESVAIVATMFSVDLIIIFLCFLVRGIF